MYVLLSILFDQPMVNCFIVLHPECKIAYFNKNWNKALRHEVMELGRSAVCHDTSVW